jgi:anaphase-promoting complex subunit 1
MEPRHDHTSAGLLLGLGCSFAGSADLLVTKVLSLHTHALLPMGSMELNASPIIQSSAMVGLGLVYAGSKNLRMAEVTLGEMGRKEMPGVEGFQDHQETYTFSAAMAFGLIMLGRGGQATSEVDRRLLAQLRRCIIGSGPSMDSGNHNAPSIDTSISAPGATVALGFMYLKTGRKDVADMLEIPQSAFALEHVRPDLLLLRTLSRALIMFDDISPTLGWIEGLIPDFIAHKGHKRTSQLELNVELAYFNIVAGACLAIGLKYAGTATEMAHNNLMFFFSILSKAASGQSMAYEGKIRRAAARQALNVVTIAWTVVMSGTGELNVLRRLRVVHGQEGAGVNYGTHMATHMACGLLFLGRGHYTLGSSNLAIAAMTIAFFPRFSATPGDNKSYPQTFRHLWALAVEPRCLVSRDVDTLETVFLPVKIKSEENGQIRHQSLISPTLIAPFENVLSIEVDSPRYWPIVYDLSNPKHKEALVRTRTIYVKRKLGFLDYNNDPKGNRSIFVRAGSVYGFDLHYDLISPASPPTISADEVVGLIRAHSGDPTLISLAKVFSGDSDLERGLRVVLLECVSLDKPAVVGVYLTLLLGLQARGWAKVELVNQLGMLKLFYSPAVFDKEYLSPLTGGERRVPLIRQNTLSALWRRLTLVEEVHSGSETSLVTRVLPGYVDRGEWPVLEIEWPAAERLAIYLAASNTPPWQLLALLKAKYQSEATAANAPVMISRLREVAKRYTEAIEGQWDVDGRSRETTALWSENSMSRVAAAWTLDG